MSTSFSTSSFRTSCLPLEISGSKAEEEAKALQQETKDFSPIAKLL